MVVLFCVTFLLFMSAWPILGDFLDYSSWFFKICRDGHLERLYCILRFSHYFFLIHKDLYIAYHGKMTFLSTELCTLPILGIKSCCLTLVISCFILLSQPLFVLCLFEKSTEKASVQQKAFIFKIAEVPSLKENCNAKTSWFHMKERSKCWRKICISLESVKPFSSY